MEWATNPYVWMAIFNCATGAFSALAGLKKVFAGPQPVDAAQTQGLPLTSNPWLYVIGGLFTIVLGVGNAYQWPIATYGTIVMIIACLYNAWFGAAKKDWRFWTLNTYVLIMTGLVVWSFWPT